MCAILLSALGSAGCGSDRAPAVDPGGTGGGIGGGAGGGGGALPPRPSPRGPLELPPADVTVDLPYQGEPVVHRIEVEVRPGLLDVHLSIDTTSSFSGEIDRLQRDLTTGVVGALASRAGDVAFGVSRMEDFPVAPFGHPVDRPFELLAPITPDLHEVEIALAALEPLGSGGDPAEAGFEALYQIGTGEGHRTGLARYIEPYDGPGEGGVGFREGSLRVVVHATDADSHVPADYLPTIPGTRGERQAIQALAAVDARLVGIASGEPARAHLERLARATGATIAPIDGTCPTGVDGAARAPVGAVCPLVFDVLPSGEGLSDALVDALVHLLDLVAYAEVHGEHGEDRLGFVRRIEALEARAASGASLPATADRRAGDGIDDTFLDARTGTTLVFGAVLANDVLPPQDYDQVFRVEIVVLGDGQLLVAQTLRIRVPGTGGRGDDPLPAVDGGIDPI